VACILIIHRAGMNPGLGRKVTIFGGTHDFKPR
jgi:hypothetical protein